MHCFCIHLDGLAFVQDRIGCPAQGFMADLPPAMQF